MFVPYICNVKDVVEGEELIVRHVARAKTKKVENKRTWRDEAKREEAEQKKQTQTKEAMTAVAAAPVIFV